MFPMLLRFGAYLSIASVGSAAGYLMLLMYNNGSVLGMALALFMFAATGLAAYINAYTDMKDAEFEIGRALRITLELERTKEIRL